MFKEANEACVGQHSQALNIIGLWQEEGNFTDSVHRETACDCLVECGATDMTIEFSATDETRRVLQLHESMSSISAGIDRLLSAGSVFDSFQTDE